MMLFRWGNPFGRAESVYSLAAAVLARLRPHIRPLDRRQRQLTVLIERRA